MQPTLGLKRMRPENDIRLAVLIDADNIPSERVKEMMKEIAKYGTPTYKRIYGNWTSPQLAGWKNVLLEHAITPIQQYSYTSGKNATDSAMIIDAMDILYTGKVEGFCIVSSDSDFTRLATRLRESGMRVIGIGEKKTPSPFIVACDKFIYLEILAVKPAAAVADVPPVRSRKKKAAQGKEVAAKPVAEKAKALQQMDQKTIDFIIACVGSEADETGWAFLGNVGNLISRQQPDFDARNFGFLKLNQLIKSLDIFEIDERESKSGQKQIYIRPRGKE